MGNIIPDRADLKLTLRSYDEATRKLLVEGVERTARSVTEMARAPAPTITHQGGTAAVVNTATLTQQAAAMLQAAFGGEAIFVPASEAGGSASEDYSELVKGGIPSVFFAIGGIDPAVFAKAQADKTPVPVNHSPAFAPVPEATIKRGAEVLTLAALMSLSGQSEGK